MDTTMDFSALAVGGQADGLSGGSGDANAAATLVRRAVLPTPPLELKNATTPATASPSVRGPPLRSGWPDSRELLTPGLSKNMI